jgi:hypothetical protein
VSVGGAALPPSLRAALTQVRYESALDSADRVEVTFSDGALRWIDDPLFALDTSFSLSLGYGGELGEPVFVGDITGHSPSFPADGGPTLTVVAQDQRHHLKDSSSVRWFAVPTRSVGNFPLPDLAVGGIVAAQHALIPIFDPIGAALSVLLGGAEIAVGLGDPQEMQRVIRRQLGESDFDFLRHLAEQHGWELVIDHSGPHGGHQLRFFSALDHLSPDVELQYGASLVDFTPRISTVGQIVAVKASIWMPSVKMGFTIKAGWDWDRRSLDVQIAPVSSNGAATTAGESSTASSAAMTLVDEPLSLASAPRVILSKLIPRLNNRLTGSGTTIGDPRIRAGTVIRIGGVGERFGGLYRVTSATHTLGGEGYRTAFEVRKEIWFGQLEQMAPMGVRVQGQQVL